MNVFLKQKEKIPVSLICVDLDHTLLSFGEYTIDKPTAQVIDRTVQVGKNILVTTGRSLVHSLSVSKQLNLSYHVCFSGALVYDLKKEKIVFSQHFLPKTSLFLQKTLENWKKELCATLYSLDKKEKTVQGYFKGQKNESFIKFSISLQDFIKVENWKILNTAKFLRVSLFADSKVLDEVFAVLKKSPHLVYAVRNYPTVIEVTGPSVDKSKGVEFVQKKLNLSWEKTLVIGDSYNDLILFKKAKYGIAVANAVLPLKKLAYAHTAAFDKQGVKKALLKWVLPKKDA